MEIPPLAPFAAESPSSPPNSSKNRANPPGVRVHFSLRIRLEVRMVEETTWLKRQQIATLFDRDIKTISKHINNALSQELRGLPTVAKFATVQQGGSGEGGVFHVTHIFIRRRRNLEEIRKTFAIHRSPFTIEIRKNICN